VPETQKPIAICARCGRKLTDPVSVARGIGPVCWGQSGGDVFEGDLEASDEEWARREECLRSGGEVDLGCNWRFDPSTREEPCLPCHIRISLRHVGGEFEAYGTLLDSHEYVSRTEVVFRRSEDLKTAYRAAVNAGPRCEAEVYRLQRAARRARRRAA
jgi:hypothetical protein